MWPGAVAVDVCLHLATEHATPERVAAGAMLVLHGHEHAHGVAPHDHNLAVGAPAPTAPPPAWSARAIDDSAAAHEGFLTAVGAGSDVPARASPPPLHLWLCTFLT